MITKERGMIVVLTISTMVLGYYLGYRHGAGQVVTLAAPGSTKAVVVSSRQYPHNYTASSFPATSVSSNVVPISAPVE